VNASGLGGAELFLAALVRRAQDTGFEQVVLNPCPGAGTPDFAARVRPVRHEIHPAYGFRAAPAVRRWLYRELVEFRPDVVHTLLFPATVAMATLARTPGAVWVQTNMYGPGLRVVPHGRLKVPLDRWAGRRFDHLVAISRAVERFLVADYGHRPEKVSCIPLGWEGTPRPHRTDPRPPTVVCVAHFRPEKGHAVLLDALLVLVGRGELEDDLRARVERLGLTGCVEMAGPVADVWPILAAAHVFALPSLSEAYGIAVAEAMAAGLPVVASAVGGVPELVDEGVTGELFAVGDHHALAGHLVRVLRSPELQARMGSCAKVAAETLRRAHSIDRYLQLLERLAADRAGARR
jgi:glycosyltransferase involved in cell wall biosynthesis